MAVRLEFIDLIVPIHKIDECYPGGFAAYKSQNRELFGGRLWHDDHLFRDGTMNPMDAQALVDFWSRQGLTPFEDRDGKKIWKDMCVVEEMFGGPTLPCDWMEFDRDDNCAYLKGTEKGRIIGRKEMHTSQQGAEGDVPNRAP